MRPFPRLFPDVAGVVGGVVAEAAPQPLDLLPDRLSIYGADSELPVAELAVPTLPRLLAANGAAPAGGMRIDATDGLSLSLGAAAGAIVELRPFGATVAITCTVPTNATEAVVTIPARSWPPTARPRRQRRLGRAGLDSSGPTFSRPRAAGAGGGARLSVEIRSAIATELRP